MFDRLSAAFSAAGVTMRGSAIAWYTAEDDGMRIAAGSLTRVESVPDPDVEVAGLRPPSGRLLRSTAAGWRRTPTPGGPWAVVSPMAASARSSTTSADRAPVRNWPGSAALEVPLDAGSKFWTGSVERMRRYCRPALTACSTRAATLSGSSCSQTRIVCQPASASSLSVSRSRSTFLAIFGPQ
jgi:hypothetical protein